MRMIEEHLRNLCQFPHRGTTTGYEHRAGDYVKEQLESAGLTVKIEEFRAPDSALYRTFIFIIICELSANFISFFGNGASIIVAVFPFFYLFMKFYLMLPIDNLIFPTGKSKNIIGIVENENAKARVVLTAHVDSQLGSYLFEEKWLGYHKTFTNVTAVCALLSVLFVIIRIAVGSGWFLTALQILVMLALLPLLLIFLKAEWTGAYVQGASDDASGVSVILKASEVLKSNPPKNLEVWVVATGAEESGLCGMMHFLKRGAGKQLDKKSTFFINHDNLGAGKLVYLTGEVLPFIRYDGDFVEIVKRASQKNNIEATAGFWDVPTDALAPTVKGFPAVTLFAYDDRGRTPNYHYFTDTLENVDMSIPQRALDLTLAVIRELDERE